MSENETETAAGWVGEPGDEASREREVKSRAQEFFEGGPLEDDDEPSIEEKARIIAGEEREDYPVHWNDEVAEAYLALKAEQQLDLVLLQQRFTEQMADTLKERHNRLLLQTATPILASMVGQLVARKEARDQFHAAADVMPNTTYSEVVVHEATVFAQLLLKACEVKG